MVKILRYITVILFTLGIILSIGGFLLDKADNIPFILRIAAPQYSDGLAAYNELVNKGSCIQEADIGYSTLSTLTLTVLEGNISSVKIVKICQGGFTSSFGKIENIALDISINEEQILSGSSYILETRLKNNELKNQGLCIQEGDMDFSTFADLKFWSLDRNVSNVKITKICLKEPVSGYNKTVEGKNTPLEITINRDQTIYLSGFELESRLENLKQKTLLVDSGIIFALGTILYILSFIIEIRKDKNEKN